MSKSKKKEVKLDNIVIVGKLTDGTYRQILIKKETIGLVLSAIITVEGSVPVSEKTLSGIEF